MAKPLPNQTGGGGSPKLAPLLQASSGWGWMCAVGKLPWGLGRRRAGEACREPVLNLDVPNPCQVPVRPPRDLRGARGSRERVSILQCPWGSLVEPPSAPFPLSWPCFPVHKGRGVGKGSDPHGRPEFMVLEALAQPMAGETKTFPRLRLEPEKVFP